ncbi:protease modulator HflC [Telmatospirillum sp.]|uniref:protease modulator HflC n=1 Tax=Telmatospirillum sp. TaxID=2079197 RepID=UPI00284F0514|nr:protease modulator HflC [Telmatospirillum sp.]MDR3437675.1 protease modulator HflC [Telmatospirillum sp.]
MNRTSLGVVGIVLLALLFVASSSLFIVRQGEQALVLRFGAVADPEDPIKGPGLHAKKPFIEEVVRYDARLLDVDPPAEQVILADQKRIEVDTYTRFRISDPLLFYQAVRTEEGARSRLREIVNNSLRRVLGNVMLPSVLSAEREQIMHEIQQQVSETAKSLGVTVVDVRIRRADLPAETSQAIFRRMESERQREAAEARAQGYERAQQIRASADRERTIILAEAQKQSQILRGQGDSDANKVYAEAFSADPNFFAFYRSLTAYRQALSDSNTTFVLTPDSDFFKFFHNAPEHR